MERITIMQGDQYAVPFLLTDMNGNALTDESLTKVEITIGPLRKVTPEITYNAETGMWDFPLTQAESLSLPAAPVPIHVRMMFPDESVVGVDAGKFIITFSQSKEVL